MSKEPQASVYGKRIVFIGSGAIATALGNILAHNKELTIHLLSIEPEVVESINAVHINSKYFPNFRLDTRLRATSDKSILPQADLIFLALPSVAVTDYLETHSHLISPQTVLVNLAKGFGRDNQLIPDSLKQIMPNTVAVMKGPSFASEIIYSQPTAFTVAASDPACFGTFNSLFANTTVYLDFTDDLKGVEYASILKNIYAIVIGIVDANFDSPNLRSLVLARSVNEMRQLIHYFGGRDATLFNYCGFGDFSLTALNDLSRNRTLGLLIGKGFFTRGISDKVVLEGRIAVNVFYELLRSCCRPDEQYPLLSELYKVFNTDYDIQKFVSRILNE